MSSIRRVIAGNWKMNHGPAATLRFFEELGEVPSGPRVVVFPPIASLGAAVSAVGRGKGIELGVQNIHMAESGAFTGETSASMAAEVGAALVLIGHSERRHIFGETDDDVAAKIVRGLSVDLEPVVCVGETLEERRAGRLEEVLDRQVMAALRAIPRGTRFLLAYEPVWAIGTGETATPADAAEAHALLRARLHAVHGEAGGNVPILYGGSVKPENAADLLDADDVDGVLVGGASLAAASFAGIIDAA
jgi:triosephosphate isomerase